jgi:hypothetical protein
LKIILRDFLVDILSGRPEYSTVGNDLIDWPLFSTWDG